VADAAMRASMSQTTLRDLLQKQAPPGNGVKG
jgi:hypothetical protein